MTYSAKSDKGLQRAVNRFHLASATLAFKGSYHPDDWKNVENEFLNAENLLKKLIERRVNSK